MTEKIIKRAEQLYQQAKDNLLPEEEKEQEKYAKMIENKNNKILLLKMLDESTQIRNSDSLYSKIKDMTKKYGLLGFLTENEKLMFKFFINFGWIFPPISVVLFKKYLRLSTQRIVIDQDSNKLKKHLHKRYKQGVGQNINLIGEVVLGEKEAINRYEMYLTALTNDDINYVSIKITSIFSQLFPLNFENAKNILIERLTNIYRQAIKYPTKDKQGNKVAKFINMDMEEYKDLELTYQVFIETLSKAEFKNLYAGIVLQAYLPDSFTYLEKLTEWAKKRIIDGGSPIKIRLVKGANIQMEEILASSKHWDNPVFETKIETDANYLKMVDFAFNLENIKAVNIGIASHNLFTISYALNKANEMGVEKFISFEMLEGMANNLVLAMLKNKLNITLYTPVVKEENFLNAVSYLVRRLDENTGPENFLSYSFGLKINDKNWKFLKEQFIQAHKLKDKILNQSRKQQNRINERYKLKDIKDDFVGEADTDFYLSCNRQWLKDIIAKWKFDSNHKPIEIPAQVGEKIFTDQESRDYIDNSQQDSSIKTYKINLHTQEQIEEVINIAQHDSVNWRQMLVDDRHKIFTKVANIFRQSRADFIGSMMAVTGKTVMEADVEVTEAIDFIEYYPKTVKKFEAVSNVSMQGQGVILVISPWNFPLAIPVGGVIAGLAAGNTVIIKPASVSAPVAYEFVNKMHEAGIPKQALQLVMPESRESLNYLAGHKNISHIILTGGTATAYSILANNPKIALSAETGGKNAIIVTCNADEDLAIKSIVQSAFGNAGQKCSACSLLLLHSSIYNSSSFKEKLKDATESLNVGSPWDLSSEIGSMIMPQHENKDLIKAISSLEHDEEWLVEPKIIDNKGFIMKPAVKWGVSTKSFTFKTELFAPLLAVVCFENLYQAIDMVNSTGYGLTSGLHSLDEEEQEIWLKYIEAGNLYINRGITGAIVARQPFGGMKASAFGIGIKAGGPNYVSCFMNFSPIKTFTSQFDLNNLPNVPNKIISLVDKTDKSEEIKGSAENYLECYIKTFSKLYDVSNVIGEDNFLRYIPTKDMIFRIKQDDDLSSILAILIASIIVKCKMKISIDNKHKYLNDILSISKDIKQETEDEFLNCQVDFKRLRLINNNVSEEYYQKFATKGVYFITGNALQNGHLELLNYLQEQSVAKVYHRYGNLGERSPF